MSVYIIMQVHVSYASWANTKVVVINLMEQFPVAIGCPLVLLSISNTKEQCDDQSHQT